MKIIPLSVCMIDMMLVLNSRGHNAISGKGSYSKSIFKTFNKSIIKY